MIRVIAVTGSMIIALASLRLGLGLQPFAAWFHVPAWMNFAGCVLWLSAAITAAVWDE